SSSTSAYISNEILTEHLEFQPLAIIDDIINMINDIMYECMSSLEKALIERKQSIDLELKRIKDERKQARLNNEDDDVIMNDDDEDQDDDQDLVSSSGGDLDIGYTIEDIEKGTASLETLMEHSINKNFDKFELYALRNILSIPQDLVDGGYIRLKHHDWIDSKKIKSMNEDELLKKSNDLDLKYIELAKKIEIELGICFGLKKLIRKVEKLNQFSSKLKNKLEFIGVLNNKSNGGSTSSMEENVKKLTPLMETFKFLIIEVKSMYEQLESIKSVLEIDHVSKLKNSINDEYLNDRINKILKELEINQINNMKLLSIDQISLQKEQTAQLLKKLNETLDRD
ncbi:hypothetical protein CANARDRAFT_185658, partial [[Candida] arabinofermentans NRRL YB-2248]